MESINQPFDSIAHMGHDVADSRDRTELMSGDESAAKHLTNGDSPRAENSPLHTGKTTNSLLHGPQNHGLRVIIVSSVVFAVAVTVALILTIYLKPDQVNGHASVASECSQCSQIGLAVLKHGGNAVDAAVATSFCLGVMNPAHSGVGGGGFGVVHDHKYKKTYAYNFRETAPAALQDLTEGDRQGIVSTGVPGMVRGLYKMHQQHGSKPWKDVLEPVVQLAYSHFPVTQGLAKEVFPYTDPAAFEGTSLAGVLLRGDGNFKTTEDNMTFPQYGDILAQLQVQPDSLYTGGLAEALVTQMSARGGLITDHDLAAYTVDTPTVLKSKFKDLTVAGPPPPSSMPLVSLILNIVDKLGWSQNMQDDPMVYHQLIEAFRYAFARESLLGDPRHDPGVDPTVTDLLTPSLAQTIADSIKADNRSFPDPSHYGGVSAPAGLEGKATHLSVVDSSELMVGLTLSLNDNFGNQVVLDSGIVLNNGLMAFDLSGNTNSSNNPQPGKRPQSAITPLILYNDDHPCDHRMVIGGSDGEGIVTGVSEVLVNWLVFNMNISQAIGRPRVHDQLGPHTQYEAGVPAAVVAALTEFGHSPELATRLLSVVQAVEKTNDDLKGVADPRMYSKAAHF